MPALLARQDIIDTVRLLSLVVANAMPADVERAKHLIAIYEALL